MRLQTGRLTLALGRGYFGGFVAGEVPRALAENWSHNRWSRVVAKPIKIGALVLSVLAAALFTSSDLWSRRATTTFKVLGLSRCWWQIRAAIAGQFGASFEHRRNVSALVHLALAWWFANHGFGFGFGFGGVLYFSGGRKPVPSSVMVGSIAQP